MTTDEIKDKILNSSDPSWFNSVNQTFDIPYLNFSKTFTGLSSIMEFVNQQLDGWNKIPDNYPQDLKNSKAYFQNISNAIDNFMANYSSQSGANFQPLWNNLLQSQFSNIGLKPFLFDSPELEFLLRVNTDYPYSFQAAFNFITNNFGNNNLNDRNVFFGLLLAYEFFSKDKSQIIERRNAEQKALSSLKSNFLKYISESETHLVSHLNIADEKFKEYSEKIEDLKNAKETIFNLWFNESKEAFLRFDQDSKKEIEDLRKTYEELLKLEKPADYWKLRGIELKREGWKSLYWLVGLVLTGCVTLYFLLWKTPEGMLTSIFSGDKSAAIRWSIVFVTFISFLFFGIRALMRVTFSSFHLARDAEERERLTYVYLALIKDASIEKEDRSLILQALFSRADTGLLKEDSSPTMPGSAGLVERVIQR